MTKNGLLLYWSGGKDCAMALYDLERASTYRNYQVSGLVTTLTQGYDRISGHGIHNSVLDRQVAALGLNVHKTFISQQSTMDEYEAIMREALVEQKGQGVRGVATGDIFVEKRRMSLFRDVGLRGCFPLMRKNSLEHYKRMVELGFEGYVVCVDSRVLDQSFVGKRLDLEFLDRLPLGVDPCGENGEYHSFMFNGPIFREKLRCKLGEIVFREGFYFCDVQMDN
jgi:uncharacterized protein (TIGR00290 family)